MKKGFTLIELLVVMVVVSILVTVALPKYRTAMEKGRGLEGFANAGVLSDSANAYYVRNYNSYGTDQGKLRTYITNVGAETTSKFFTHSNSGASDERIVLADGTVTITLNRNLGAKSYNIVFVNSNGEVTSRYCTGYEKYCKSLGATTVRSEGGWFF